MDFGPLVPANNPVVRELQPSQNSDLGRAAGPRFYPDLPLPRNLPSASIFEFWIKRKWYRHRLPGDDLFSSSPSPV